MLKKFKSIFKPDWNAIIQGVYANIIYWALGLLALVGVGLWAWFIKLDPLGFRFRMSQVFVILLYMLTALGAGFVLYIPWRIWSRKRSPILMKFSVNLDKETKNKDITGIGLHFLREIKFSPPFLGIRHTKPIISAPDEQILTEYFRACVYMEEYKNSIHGGNYQIKKNDTRKSIAKNVYSSSKYVTYVEEYFHYPTGSILFLPYINTSSDDPSDFVVRQMGLSQNEGRIVGLLGRYNLVEDESIRLMRWVFDAAQRTLAERKK